MIKTLFGKIFPALMLSISLICYLSIFIPPDMFWPAAVVGYAIPALVCINVGLFLLYIFGGKISWQFLVGILAGLPFIQSTYQTNELKEVKSDSSFMVLSYNAKLFRQKDRYDKFSVNSIEWLIKDSAKIKCIQEFSYNTRYKPLDVVSRFEAAGYNHHVFDVDLIHNPGMAILTKYPILEKGIVDHDSRSVNNMIYADILIKRDTVRIYNVHLKSMRLELHEYSEVKKAQRNYKKLINKLRFGAIERSAQIEKLLAHTKNCTYPMIICGDFNETPYSYNYFQMKSNFKNSFEQAGNGLGLSYVNKPLRLRIDHHFFNDDISVTNYQIDKQLYSSDHFPTRAVYKIK